MASQATFYPNQCRDTTQSPICTTCNTLQTYPACCPSFAASNSSNETAEGKAAYCKGGSCNGDCNTVQNYQALSKTKVSSHGDFGLIPTPTTGCLSTDQTIYLGWTASYWNNVNKKLQFLASIGAAQPHNSGLVTQDVSTDEFILGSTYNTLMAAFNDFSAGRSMVVGNQNGTGDIIKQAHADAITTAWNAMYFRGTTCDICNAGPQGVNAGVTVDECACSCNCGCDCPCDCSCSCSCSCGSNS